MMDKPIVVLFFEGVIGDIFQQTGSKDTQLGLQRSSYASRRQKEGYGMYFRSGAVKGLRQIASLFQTVVFCKSGNKKKVERVKEWLIKNNLSVDALYASTRKEPKAYEDFAQLYIDFNILDERKVAEKLLFVNSVELSANDVRHRANDEDMLFQAYTSTAASSSENFNVSFLPFSLSYSDSSGPAVDSTQHSQNTSKASTAKSPDSSKP